MLASRGEPTRLQIKHSLFQGFPAPGYGTKGFIFASRISRTATPASTLIFKACDFFEQYLQG
jgi:hypothetical protein